MERKDLRQRNNEKLVWRNPFPARKALLATVCIATAGAVSQAHSAESLAFNWLSFGATNQAKPNAVTGWGTESGKTATIQYEHYGANEWGSFYFDLQSTHGRGVGSIAAFKDNGKAYELYADAVPTLSLSKVTGRSFTFGFISDVSLIASLQQSTYYHWQAAEFGLNLSIAAPGFAVFDTGLLTHDTWWDISPTFDRNTGRNYRLDKNKWVWRTYMISKPIDIGNQRFNFNLQSYVSTSGNGDANKHGTEVLLITDYLWNIGGNSDYQLGLRHIYSSHKNSPSIGFGDNSYRSSVPSLLFKYTL